MFALTVLRILLALSFVFVLCSAQKSFLKGLLIGSLLGHKKGSLLHEKGESKDIHHYEKEYYPPPPQKEYIPVPVHEEPKFIPIYIVKDCPKKSFGAPHIPMDVHHHHDHHHNYEYSDNKLSDFGSESDGYSPEEEYPYASASKYKGTLEGYTETGYNKAVGKKPNLTSGNLENGESSDDIGVVLSVHKNFGNQY